MRWPAFRAPAHLLDEYTPPYGKREEGEKRKIENRKTHLIAMFPSHHALHVRDTVIELIVDHSVRVSVSELVPFPRHGHIIDLSGADHAVHA